MNSEESTTAQIAPKPGFFIEDVLGQFTELSHGNPFRVLDYPTPSQTCQKELSEVSFLNNSCSEEPVATGSARSERTHQQMTPINLDTVRKEARETFDSPDEVIGASPSRLYCPQCRKYVSTVVRYKVVTRSFWEILCCSSSSAAQPHHLVHCCRSCFLELASLAI